MQELKEICNLDLPIRNKVAIYKRVVTIPHQQSVHPKKYIPPSLLAFLILVFGLACYLSAALLHRIYGVIAAYVVTDCSVGNNININFLFVPICSE
jgi:hypothetical protein